MHTLAQREGPGRQWPLGAFARDRLVYTGVSS